jgi:hypothetical protein
MKTTRQHFQLGLLTAVVVTGIAYHFAKWGLGWPLQVEAMFDAAYWTTVGWLFRSFFAWRGLELPGAARSDGLTAPEPSAGTPSA